MSIHKLPTEDTHTARQIAFLSIFYFYLESASIAANAAESIEDYKAYHRRRRRFLPAFQPSCLPAAAAQIAVIIKSISPVPVFCRMRQEKQEKLLGRSHRYTLQPLQARCCRRPIPKSGDLSPQSPQSVMSGWTFSRQIYPFSGYCKYIYVFRIYLIYMYIYIYIFTYSLSLRSNRRIRYTVYFLCISRFH